MTRSIRYALLKKLSVGIKQDGRGHTTWGLLLLLVVLGMVLLV
jgi:hypothetical protein